MKDLEFYSGREQTYVKHFFLEKYLETLAFHILSRRSGLVYVDGFSGPWSSADESLGDTSFAIAVRKLRLVENFLFTRDGKRKRIRLLFIEEDADAFSKLSGYVSKIDNFEAKAIHGKFEDHISDIVEFIGNDFSFSFVDPKGWSGANPTVLEPLLQLEGEVLINFMYDFVNRFLTDERPGTRISLGSLFPDMNAEEEVKRLEDSGLSREDAILELYKGSIHKKSGNLSLSLVTSMAVMNRRAKRTHYHLVYRTRNWKGIQKFRDVERQTMPIQDMARKVSRFADKRQQNSGQSELFADAPILPDRAAIEKERQPRLIQAKQRLDDLLRTESKIPYSRIVAIVLSTPMVFDKDLKDWLQERHKSGEIRIDGLRGKSTRPNEQCTIVRNPH